MARDINQEPVDRPDPRPRNPRPAPRPIPPKPPVSTPVPPPAPTTPTRPAPPKVRNPRTTLQLRDAAVQTYLKSGGVDGPLGWPVAPVQFQNDTASWQLTGGRITATLSVSNAYIERYFTVRYLGFRCWAESKSDQGSSSDEPYFLISFSSGSIAFTGSKSYTKVNSGKVVHAEQTIADRVPIRPSMLHVLAMESDMGSKKEARRKVEEEVKKISAAATQVASLIDVASAAGSSNAGTYAALAGGLTSGPLAGLLFGGAVAVLDLGDDLIGEEGHTLFAPEVGYGQPPDQGTFAGVKYTHKCYCDGGSAGKYDVYFRVDVMEDEAPVHAGTGIMPSVGMAEV